MIDQIRVLRKTVDIFEFERFFFRTKRTIASYDYVISVIFLKYVQVEKTCEKRVCLVQFKKKKLLIY